MKIELKNIHHSEQLSEETNAFSANLYINDLKAGTASNRGHGGPTDYYAMDERGKGLIKEAEAYCKQLPPEKFTVGGKEYTLDSNLESFIDRLLDKHLEQKDLQKFRNKIDKAAKNGIVIGIADSPFRTFRVLPLKFPVDLLLVHPNGPQRLTDIIAQRIKPEMKENEQVLNTNIPEKIMLDAGLTTKQYALQSEDKPVNKATRKRKGPGI